MSLGSFSIKDTLPGEMGQAVGGKGPLLVTASCSHSFLVRMDARAEWKIKATEFRTLKRMNKKMCS